jgi:hypothetical protein
MWQKSEDVKYLIMSMPVASTWGHEFSLQVSGAWGGVKDGAVAYSDNATVKFRMIV